MKIGFCAKPEEIERVAAAGFDYLEPAVSYVAEKTDEEFEALLTALQAAPIPTPSFNVLFPGSISLMGGTADEEIRAYLDKALGRVQRMGGKVVVFGSGRARFRPEGMAYGDAFRRLIDVTRMMGDAAAKYGLTIVIEPLNRGETNTINSVAEGACLAAAVHHPNVKLLADYYHVAVENQPPEDVARVGGIAHAHIATKVGRMIPLEKDEGYAKMFTAMKQTGYEGLISVEGRCDDLAADGPRAVRMLKEMWEEA